MTRKLMLVEYSDPTDIPVVDFDATGPILAMLTIGAVLVGVCEAVFQVSGI